MKRIISLVLLALSLSLCLIPGLPTNVLGARERLAMLEESTNKTKESAGELRMAERKYNKARSEFDNQRRFDISYTDVENIIKVLSNIKGLTVKSIMEIDPAYSSAEIAEYAEGSNPKALKITIMSDEPQSALKVIDKMDLPIIDVNVTEPNKLTFSFLTGGDINA